MNFSYNLYIKANIQFKYRVYLNNAVLKFSPPRRTARKTDPQAPCVCVCVILSRIIKLALMSV
jgi:hypothetical protein